MNRRGFLAGLCGAVAAVLGWTKKVESKPPLYYDPSFWDVYYIVDRHGKIWRITPDSVPARCDIDEPVYHWHRASNTIRRIQ